MSIIWSDRVLKILLWLSVFATIIFTSPQQKVWWLAGIFAVAAIAKLVIWKMASPEEKKAIGVKMNSRNIFFYVLMFLVAIIYILIVVWQRK